MTASNSISDGLANDFGGTFESDTSWRCVLSVNDFSDKIPAASTTYREWRMAKAG